MIIVLSAFLSAVELLMNTHDDRIVGSVCLLTIQLGRHNCKKTELEKISRYRLADTANSVITEMDIHFSNSFLQQFSNNE